MRENDSEVVGSTIVDNILAHASRRPDDIALVAPCESIVSYQQLQGQIASVHALLRSSGFGRRDRIIICVEDRLLAILATVVVTCCATAIPLDPRVSSVECAELIRRSGAVALLIEAKSAFAQLALAQGISVLEVAIGDDQRLHFQPVSLLPRNAADEEPARPDDIAFIVQSSGTTGRAKLIPFTHANMVASAKRMQIWFEFSAEDRCLSIAAPYYSHGLTVTIFTPLITGGGVAIPRSTTVSPIEWFQDLSPTWCSAGPSHYRAMIDHAKGEPISLPGHRLRFVLSGGALLAPELAEEWGAVFGLPLFDHYGLSEAAQMSANLPRPGLQRAGTCGLACPGLLSVVDSSGAVVAPGRVGHILVRGPTVSPGYIDDQHLTERHFKDGWFCTGDLGSLDATGFLTLEGRADDMINRGGEKVSPLEVERALMAHPAVLEAAAFPIPHERLGQDIYAAVVVRSGVQIDPLALRRQLFRRLSGFKVPRQIFVVAELPKGKTGKVQRHRLAQLSARAADVSMAIVHGSSLDPMSLEYHLLASWRQHLKKPDLTEDDNFFEAGGDSLLALEMLVEFDWLADPRISGQLLVEAATVKQFAASLSKYTNALSKPLTRIHREGTRLPLVFFHGDFMDGGLYVQRLARLLGPERPLLIVAPHGMQGGEAMSSIEEMARDRAHVVGQERPDGPILIGGHCSGALVAFEVARILANEGRDVRGVFMIDPPTVNARAIPRKLLHFVGTHWPNWLVRAYDLLVRFEMLKKASVGKIILRTRTKSASRTKPLSWHMYTSLMAQYLPMPVDLPVYFFSASFDGRGWGTMTSELQVVEVPGGHSGCVTTHAPELVERLKGAISSCEEIQTRSSRSRAEV